MPEADLQLGIRDGRHVRSRRGCRCIDLLLEILKDACHGIRSLRHNRGRVNRCGSNGRLGRGRYRLCNG